MVTIPSAQRVPPHKAYSLEACHMTAQTMVGLLLTAGENGGVRVHRASRLPQHFKQAVWYVVSDTT